MAIRGVLFDWGGTIVSNDPVLVGASAVAVAAFARGHLEVDVTDADFARAFQSVLPEYRPGETGTSPSSAASSAQPSPGSASPCANDVEACAACSSRIHTR